MNWHACTLRNGKPKTAYATWEEANAAATTRADVGVKVYHCTQHGWHLGGELSRGLREALWQARRPPPKRGHDE